MGVVMRSGDNNEFKSKNESLGYSVSEESAKRVINRKQLVLLKSNLEYFKKLKDTDLAVFTVESDFIRNAADIEYYLSNFKLTVASEFTLKDLKDAFQN